MESKISSDIWTGYGER